MVAAKAPLAPTELSALFGIPATKDAVQKTTDESVAATDAIKHTDLPGLDNVPVGVVRNDRAPHM